MLQNLVVTWHSDSHIRPTRSTVIKRALVPTVHTRGHQIHLLPPLPLVHQLAKFVLCHRRIVATRLTYVARELITLRLSWDVWHELIAERRQSAYLVY